MPHDAYNQLLKVGDPVFLRGEIVHIDMYEDYCNVKVRAIHPAKPFEDANAMTTFYFNASQLEKSQESK